jgi:hypothetical protein
MADGKVGFLFFKAKNLPSKRKTGAKKVLFFFRFSPPDVCHGGGIYRGVRRMLDHLTHAQTHTKKGWLGNVIWGHFATSLGLPNHLVLYSF